MKVVSLSSCPQIFLALFFFWYTIRYDNSAFFHNINEGMYCTILLLYSILHIYFYCMYVCTREVVKKCGYIFLVLLFYCNNNNICRGLVTAYLRRHTFGRFPRVLYCTVLYNTVHNTY